LVTKLPHYTLPAFPFLALLFGRRWILAGLSAASPARVLVIFGVVMALLSLFLVRWVNRHGLTPSPVGVLVNQAQADRSLLDRINIPAMRLALVDFQEPNAVWEVRRGLEPWMVNPAAPAGAAEVIAGDQVLPYLRKPGLRGVILTSGSWDKLKAGADASWHVYEATGFNAARLRNVDLVLVVKPATTGHGR
jgi:hypothetical protein